MKHVFADILYFHPFLWGEPVRLIIVPHRLRDKYIKSKL